ncbi:MAG: hypothetical protein ACR2F1_05645 [Nitrososphaeraceae archaeon]
MAETFVNKSENNLRFLNKIKLFLRKIKRFASKTLEQIRSFASTRPYQLSDLDHNIVDDHGNEGYKEMMVYETKINSTNWISYEIDKIVSIIYFAIIILLLIIVLQDESLYSNFVNLITNVENTNNDNVLSVFYTENRLFLIIFLIISIILLGITITVKLKRLKNRVDVIKVYFKVSDEIEKYKNSYHYEILLDNIKNLLLYINNRDWGMAEYFAKNITDRTNKIEIDSSKEKEKSINHKSNNIS